MRKEPIPWNIVRGVFGYPITGPTIFKRERGTRCTECDKQIQPGRPRKCKECLESLNQESKEL